MHARLVPPDTGVTTAAAAGLTETVADPRVSNRGESQ